MHKRSQAAMEFLVTYGWSILAVLIVVAALAYFGVFSGSRYVDDLCDFGDQLSCEDYIANEASSSVMFKLRNNFGVPIDFLSVDSDLGGCTYALGLPSTLAEGQLSEDFTCNVGAITAEDKVRMKSTITFSRSTSTNQHVISGIILTGVNPSP